MRSGRAPRAERPSKPPSPRDRLAVLLAIVTAICLGAAFLFSSGKQFLAPGPLASAHGAIENCGACHTKSGSGSFSWVQGLVPGDPLADSKACLTCHKMPKTAFNPHGALPDVLKQSTKRLAKVAAVTPAPQSARAQSIAFPTDAAVAGGLNCATCHQEHKGANFNLSKISNEQCRSCHVVKFDSFDGDHPRFDNYPFKSRTQIVYDHAGHFGKHFPDVAQKDKEKRIPATCSTCHTSRADKRIMAVAPFEQTCTDCHLDQIVGKERATGPKGIAFLTLPGLDVRTLKEKNAAIGEWPEGSEAELTPFMKVMISRSEKGRAIIKTVSGVNLQDLGNATEEQLKAVTGLVWEIKGLFYALISGKASDVLGDLNIGGGAKLSPSLVADLTASLPRDVVISAHQEWLPNLATEMASGQAASDQDQGGWAAAITESRLAASVSPEELFGAGSPQASPRSAPQTGGGDAASSAKPVQLAQANQLVQSKSTPGTVAEKSLRIDPYGRVAKTPEEGIETAQAAPPVSAAREPASADIQPQAKAADQTDDLLSPDGGTAEAPARGPENEPVAAQPQPRAAARPEAPAGGGRQVAAADPPPQGKPGDQNDDLLNPDGGAADSTGGASDGPVGGASPEVSAAPADAAPAGAEPQGRAAPGIVSIQSDVDAESWAEYGGWYHQDFGIFYRPTGHKDKFIYSWLFLTGPQAPKGNKGPAAAVFDSLIDKDAQGSCTKCHSVDDIRGKGRLVNFSPPKVDTKQGRFTNFIHEPHFGILENRGCLTCHNLEKGRPYLKSYEQGNPLSFVSNFGAVKKELCQTCHTSTMARQDCLTCHKYHVNGVVTPIMNTRIPTP
ncbi:MULTISPECIES: hypothetical protein [Rhodomicrobium]|uniref:hypothetical protein n=1 Tax=Rhodomicrobium TaxID=1068 RepID=UPI000F73CCE6|nr:MULTISPECIES: hypothetical protein [Rhodomicrobium]